MVGRSGDSKQNLFMDGLMHGLIWGLSSDL